MKCLLVVKDNLAVRCALRVVERTAHHFFIVDGSYLGKYSFDTFTHQRGYINVPADAGWVNDCLCRAHLTNSGHVLKDGGQHAGKVPSLLGGCTGVFLPGAQCRNS